MKSAHPARSTRSRLVFSLLIGVCTMSNLTRAAAHAAEKETATAGTLSDAEAWKRLPAAERGQGLALPVWARILAGELPRTTAALLQLDYAQRTKSPVAPSLRAAMRWVAAHENRCAYAEACAAADGRSAGLTDERLSALAKAGFPGWSAKERAALEFARKMTVDSDSVTDDEFAELVGHFGEKQAASMVLLMAYANFQDRLLLCLDVKLEKDGLLPPVAVAFAPGAFVVQTTPPPPLRKTPLPKPTGHDLIEDDDPEWRELTYEALQERLERQRRKPTRLRIPSWDEVAGNLPEGLMKRPSDIIWYRIVFGYAPELAVPFEYFMRTAGAEAAPKWDRIFGSGLFWVATRAVKCPYCMGHCEMTWEVAGLNKEEIAERSRLLAGDDWSSFPAAEQRAFAFARKLSKTPWKITRGDVEQLNREFGPDRALITMLNASRYHYMVRISNGFQLTLERENVFYDYFNVKPAGQVEESKMNKPNVPLLSSDESWKRMPRAVAGGGQPLPSWVRGVAGPLPRTAAAMLQLDFAHRTKSPLDPVLRGKMRWVIAHANRCAYSEAYALADLKRAGCSQSVLDVLKGPASAWPEEDREPLELARLLTVAAPTIPDDLFERLRRRLGDKKVAAMVLLAAYGNFQDRIVLGLNLEIESEGPLPPVEVAFVEDAFQVAPFVPPQTEVLPLARTEAVKVEEDPEWTTISYDELQSRLERQRDRKPRLPVPEWEQVRKNVPPAMAARPTRIIWNLVCSGYVPELAVPWSISTRTMWAEAKPDRVFEESLFWVQTRSIGCNYCMGHCEMLLEVAGLDKAAIAERTRLLAGSDWSMFPPAEQRAYAYARKLSKTPWALTAGDYQTLEKALGADKAMATFWWLCRGLYMTRVSDGFQLPLERENVFQNLPATSVASAKAPEEPEPGAKPAREIDAAEIERLSRLSPEEIEKEFEGSPQPESVRMLLAIARGSLMGAGDGWFGPAQSRFSWDWLAKQHDLTEDDAKEIPEEKFTGPKFLFDRLDRNKDGKISPDDLDWSDRNPWVQQAYLINRLFRRMDPNGDGQITRDTWLAFFDRARNGKDFLGSDDLRDALLAGTSSGFLPGDAPSKEVLTRGLIAGEVGSLREGPKVGQAAPDFTLQTHDGKQTVRLSDVIGKQPVVLVFGNYTCGPFRSMYPGADDVYKRFKDQAVFLAIYVREAHPTDGWHMESNTRLGVKTAQPKTYDERVSVARQCHGLIKPSMPLLVDDISDPVGSAYSGMPARMYVIDREGKVAYKGGRGPFGFKTGEMEQALVMTLLQQSAAKSEKPEKP